MTQHCVIKVGKMEAFLCCSVVHFILVACNPRGRDPSIQVRDWLNPTGVFVNQYAVSLQGN